MRKQSTKFYALKRAMMEDETATLPDGRGSDT